MNKKIIIFTILCISVLLLSACVPQEPTSNFPPVEEEKKIEFINELLPVEVNYEDVVEQVRIYSTEFIATPADEFGDESTFNRLPGSSTFEVATKITATYVSPEQYVGETISLKIIDERNDELVYDGTLNEGTNEYVVLLDADHAGYSPRFKLCLGGTSICEQSRTDMAINKLSTNINAIDFHIGRKVVEKQIIVTNEGNTHVTVFVHLSQGEDYELFSNITSTTLAPGEDTTITISTTGTKKGGKASVNIYALGDSCSLGEECATTAKLKNEIVVEYNS